MAIMNSAPMNRFQGTRSKIVRESDQKEYYGWVVETESELVITIDGDMPAESDKLEVQLGSKTGSCTFSGSTSRIIGNRCSFEWPKLIRIGEPMLEARKKSEKVRGMIETPVEILDIAPSGIGLMTDFNLETGASVDLRLTTDYGDMSVRGSVVYCRPEGTQFRVGLKLNELSRLDQARWDQILAA